MVGVWTRDQQITSIAHPGLNHTAVKFENIYIEYKKMTFYSQFHYFEVLNQCPEAE